MTRKRGWILAVGVVVLLAIVLGVSSISWLRDDDDQAFQLRAAVPSDAAAFAAAVYQSLGVEMRPGHQVALLGNGAIFDRLEVEIRNARSGVNVVMYIWEKGAASDRLVAALNERGRAGVQCRILVDSFGSPDFSRDVQPVLEAGGCEVREFRPPPISGDELARNHRKIVVIDGRVAFTGGFGVRDNWLGDGISHDAWRDANVRFTGAAVGGAQQAFAENWQEAGGALLPAEAFPAPDTSGPAFAAFVTSTGSPVLTRAERLVQLLIQASKKRLWIANAYFVPSPAILSMIERKSAEGVDVRLLAPGKKSDSKTSFGAQHIEYESLLKRGVRVFEYQPSMMHAKTMLVDAELALVGSINLDPLSLNKLEEAALLVHDRAFATELARSFEADCVHAKELSTD